MAIPCATGISYILPGLWVHIRISTHDLSHGELCPVQVALTVKNIMVLNWQLQGVHMLLILTQYLLEYFIPLPLTRKFYL